MNEYILPAQLRVYDCRPGQLEIGFPIVSLVRDDTLHSLDMS
jgi:hypothetical protein